MSSVAIGFLGILVLLIMLALKVPIGVALGLVSLSGIWILRTGRAAYGALGSIPFDFAAHWSLSAVPMFLLMGSVAYHSGLTSSLFTAARVWLSFLPGGLAVASNFASAGFAAASGSSLATAAAMGRLAIPEMLKRGYDPALATGVVAAGGTLGALIPPSILIVLYGWAAEQPVGQLLIAGIIPGLLTAFVYSVMIILRCLHNPDLAPRIEEKVTWKERFDALKKVWPLPLLIFSVIGSIYSGFTTPTEAGAFGAMLAIVIALLQGRFTKEVIKNSLSEALESTSAIFFIGIGAVLFARFIGFSGIPDYLAGFVEVYAVNPLLLVIGSSLVYILLGMFLDPIGLMLITLPVLLPMFEAANLNLIWMGIIIIKYLEIGLLTPPVGLNAYVIKGVVGDQVALSTIFRGLTWFILAEVVIMTLLISFPDLVTFLPELMAD